MRQADGFPLRIGDSASRVRTFTAADVAGYRDLAGDAGLGFGDGGDGVPGPLLAGMISDLLGTSLPGLGTMWMKQTLEYGGSVPVGAEVVAEVTIARMKVAKGLVYLDATCRCEGRDVVSGSTLVMVPNLETRAAATP